MNELPAIRILVVDDHPVVREGLSSTINYQADMNVIAQAANGKEALERYRKYRPDVTLMDLEMPEMDGVTTTAAIREEFPEACIIFLTTYGSDDDVCKGTRAGAIGCLLKDTPMKDVLETIRTAHRGGKCGR